MKRRLLQYLLTASLLVSAAFATWAWLRPYDFHPDPAARCAIVETLVTRDQSYFWVDVHLKMNDGMIHEMSRPVTLEAGAGARLKPADITFGGTDLRAPGEIWFKFWLEPEELTGPLALLINDGKLVVKSTSGVPDLGNAAYRNFTTHRW